MSTPIAALAHKLALAHRTRDPALSAIMSEVDERTITALIPDGARQGDVDIATMLQILLSAPHTSLSATIRAVSLLQHGDLTGSDALRCISELQLGVKQLGSVKLATEQLAQLSRAEWKWAWASDCVISPPVEGLATIGPFVIVLEALLYPIMTSESADKAFSCADVIPPLLRASMELDDVIVEQNKDTDGGVEEVSVTKWSPGQWFVVSALIGVAQSHWPVRSIPCLVGMLSDCPWQDDASDAILKHINELESLLSHDYAPVLRHIVTLLSKAKSREWGLCLVGVMRGVSMTNLASVCMVMEIALCSVDDGVVHCIWQALQSLDALQTNDLALCFAMAADEDTRMLVFKRMSSLLAQPFDAIIELIRCSAGESMAHLLLEFGTYLVSLDGNKWRGKLAVNTIRQCGITILKHLLIHVTAARAAVLNACFATLSQAEAQSFESQALPMMLAETIRDNVALFHGHSTQLCDWLQFLPLFGTDTGTSLITALNPLLHVQTGLSDKLHMTLRKMLGSRKIDDRVFAARLYPLLVRDVDSMSVITPILNGVVQVRSALLKGLIPMMWGVVCDVRAKTEPRIHSDLVASINMAILNHALQYYAKGSTGTIDGLVVSRCVDEYGVCEDMPRLMMMLVLCAETCRHVDGIGNSDALIAPVKTAIEQVTTIKRLVDTCDISVRGTALTPVPSSPYIMSDWPEPTINHDIDTNAKCSLIASIIECCIDIAAWFPHFFHAHTVKSLLIAHGVVDVDVDGEMGLGGSIAAILANVKGTALSRAYQIVDRRMPIQSIAHDSGSSSIEPLSIAVSMDGIVPIDTLISMSMTALEKGIGDRLSALKIIVALNNEHIIAKRLAQLLSRDTAAGMPLSHFQAYIAAIDTCGDDATVAQVYAQLLSNYTFTQSSVVTRLLHRVLTNNISLSTSILKGCLEEERECVCGYNLCSTSSCRAGCVRECLSLMRRHYDDMGNIADVLIDWFSVGIGGSMASGNAVWLAMNELSSVTCDDEQSVIVQALELGDAVSEWSKQGGTAKHVADTLAHHETLSTSLLPRADEHWLTGLIHPHQHTVDMAPQRKKQRLRSRNAFIDDALQDEDGNDAYADLEDFIV